MSTGYRRPGTRLYDEYVLCYLEETGRLPLNTGAQSKYSLNFMASMVALEIKSRSSGLNRAMSCAEHRNIKTLY